MKETGRKKQKARTAWSISFSPNRIPEKWKQYMAWDGKRRSQRVKRSCLEGATKTSLTCSWEMGMVLASVVQQHQQDL